MPDAKLSQLLTAQGGVPVDSADLVGTALVLITQTGASFVTTLYDILALPTPVRQIPGLADTPQPVDIGRLLESRANSASLTVITLDKDLGVLAGTDWPSQATLDFQQMGTSRIHIVAASGATLLAPSGAFSRTQGSLVRVRHDAANHWVVTGDVTTT